MKGTTHLAMGLLTGFTFGSPTLGVLIPVAVGSLLPDIDHQNSILGKYLPLGRYIKHRTWTHSVYALGLAYLINSWLALGVASHIFLDMLTPARVPLFYPNRTRFGIKFIKTGGPLESLLRLGLCYGLFLSFQAQQDVFFANVAQTVSIWTQYIFNFLT